MNLFVVTAVGAVDITALCTALGALACLLWVIPPANPERDNHGHRIGMLVALCLAVLSVDSLLLLLYRSHVLSGQSYGQLGPLIPKVVGYTHYGHVWLVRVAALAAGWGVWWYWRRNFAGRRWTVVTAAVLAVVAFTRSATGHSADQGDFTLLELMDWLHLMGVSLWAGTVVASVLLVLRPGGEEQPAAASFNVLAHRLSRLATLALLLVLVTGCYNTWEKLLTVDALWQTEYGNHLLVKIGIVGIMIGLGAANRSLHLRKLPVDPPAGAAEQTTVQRRFIRILRIEAVTALVVFIAAAILINTVPPHAVMNGMGGMPM